MRAVRRCVVLAMLPVCGAMVVACDPPEVDRPPDTVGTLPDPGEPTTLLPVIVEDTIREEGTAPPGALFAGDFCAALTEDDLAAVAFTGRGRGTLADVPVSALDGCSYTVAVGDETVDVVVTARSQSDFAGPGGEDDTVEELTGIGEAARGVDRGEAYEVYVKVSNGWFSVLTPDAASAKALARRAVPRADQG